MYNIYVYIYNTYCTIVFAHHDESWSEPRKKKQQTKIPKFGITQYERHDFEIHQRVFEIRTTLHSSSSSFLAASGGELKTVSYNLWTGFVGKTYRKHGFLPLNTGGFWFPFSRLNLTKPIQWYNF